MNHFIFATEFEATELIAESKQLSENIYLHDKAQIFICGMGLVLSAGRFSEYCQKHIKQGDHVYNFGIAGAINPHLELHQIYQVQSSEIYNEHIFRSGHTPIFDAAYPRLKLELQTLKGAVDPASKLLSEQRPPIQLASSVHPIWQEDEVQLLRQHKIDLIDMEGYSLVQIAMEQKLNFKVYKAVSDYARKASQKDFIKNAKLAIQNLTNFIKQDIE